MLFDHHFLIHRFTASLVVTGCAAAPPLARPPAPPPAVVVPDARSEPEPPEPATPPPALAEIREPEQAACRLSAGDWSFWALRLSADGERFASVTGAAVTLVVPVADKPRVAVAAFDGAVRIRLVVRASDVKLYAKGPRTLLGIVTPAAHAAFDFVAASPGSLELHFDASEVLASPAPIQEKLGCSDTVIVPSEFDARASITKRKNLPKRWVARDGVPIAAEKGGSSVATLVEGVEVGVLEARGGQSRVLAEGSKFVVAGWVASKDLTTTSSHGVGYGTGMGTFGRRVTKHMRPPSCVHDLTLIGELGDERAIIGHIPAGTHYRVLDDAPAAEAEDAREPREELAQVELPYAPWLHLVKGARLLTKRSELSTCSPARAGGESPSP